MKSTITRRKMLSGTAASAVALGASSALPALAAPSAAHDCAQKHALMSKHLAYLALDPHVSDTEFNTATKLWHCPHCQTQISADASIVERRRAVA